MSRIKLKRYIANNSGNLVYSMDVHKYGNVKLKRVVESEM